MSAWARKQATSGARDASELPSRKVHPHLFISSSSYLRRHIISILAASTTQLVFSKTRLVRQRLNTAALTSPCVFPLSSWSPLRPFSLASPTPSSPPILYILRNSTTRTLALNLFSTLLTFLATFLYVSLSNRGPRPCALASPTTLTPSRRIYSSTFLIHLPYLYYTFFGSTSTTSYPCHVGNCQNMTSPLSFLAAPGL